MKSKRMRWLSFLLKACCLALVLSVNILLFWRMCSSSDPESMTTLSVTPAMLQVYEEKGNLNIFTQEQNTITRAEKNYGYFSISQFLFLTDTNEVQLVFRYNDSTVRHLVEDYSLPEEPATGSDLYEITLLIATDLTPDDKSDNDGNDPASVSFTRVHAKVREVYGETKDEKTVYNYRKFVFEGVEITDLTLAVYADIYYVGDVNYEAEAYGTLCLYDWSSEKKPYTLTSADKSNLEAARKEWGK